MAINVFVYNSSLKPEPYPSIEIYETDHWGVNIDHTFNTSLPGSPLSPEYGGTLAAPSPAQGVIVWLDDATGAFAPVSLGELYGNKAVVLHVTLYRLPAPGPGGGPGGGPAKTLDTASALIMHKVKHGVWTEEQGTGVRSLVDAYARAQLLPSRSNDLQQRIRRWHSQLILFGIELAEKAIGQREGGTFSAY